MALKTLKKISILKAKFIKENNQDKLNKLITLVGSFDKITQPQNLNNMVEAAQNTLSELSK